MINILLLSILIPTIGNHTTQKLDKKVHEHNLVSEETIMFIDYSLPITEKRFFVYNPKTKEILYSDYVGHAHKSGDKRPVKTSNKPGSLKTSLGLYKVGNEYDGQYGLSIRLRGLSKSNSNAFKRSIVVHTIIRPDSTLEFTAEGQARYIGPDKNKLSYLYSEGCFVFYQESYIKIIDLMKKGKYLIVFN